VRSVTEILGAGAPAPVHVPSAPLRVLVSEPDIVSRRFVCALLERESGMMVTCVDDSRLVSSIQESAPDLVIVDAHTPAIRRASSWGAVGINAAPATIVTAYDSSAVSAFASTAIDFLVKPFDPERFEAALDLVKSEIARERAKGESGRFLSGKQGDLPRTCWLQRLVVESDHKILLVRVEDVDWIQSCGDYVRLHIGSTCHLLRRTMKELHAQLDPKRFLRVHRSAIVNLDRVKEFYLPPTGNMFVTLSTGFSLPLRRHSRFSLRRLLKDIS
jgi:two-component system, LytTR family, response regulator